MIDLLRCLIDTGALQVAPADRPFWYTSGTLGPYYIHTHYLYGSREKAEGFLEVIEREKGDPLRCPTVLLEQVRRNYAEDPIYRGVVDRIVEIARDSDEAHDAGYVSGGERRDWFFSLMAGEILGKPLLLIYKDLTVVEVSGKRHPHPIDRLDGRRVVHVADLITEASSYTRAWIPAIEDRGGRMACAVNVVDRDQGGAEALGARGVTARALVRIDGSMFEAMRQAGAIDDAQLRMLVAYREDPRGSMRAFLTERPEFLRNALASPDPRTAERARLLVQSDPYQIGWNPAP